MAFPWLSRTSPREGGADRRAAAERAELASRAGILYRLGFSEAAAARRLAATVAWEYDLGAPNRANHRPAALSDAAIAQIVAETYARRPG